MEYKDYYRILGVSRDASADEIKRAYRKLARKYHPDVSKEHDAEQRFKEMKEAYEVLKDPEKRSAYDRFGTDWKMGGHRPQDFEREFSFDGGGFSGGHGAEFSDFFNSLFGGGSPFESQFRNASRTAHDMNARITIPLEDAFHGATRQITLDVPGRGQHGQVKNARRTFSVRIPKGVTAGQRIRLEGQGSGGGNVYLEVQFEPHPVFEVDGRDVHVKLPVTPSQAALGRTVEAPTLGGAVDLKIPPGSSSGKRLRLKGRGLPGSPPGDQFVEINIVMPKTVDERMRALYEQLEKLEGSASRQKSGHRSETSR